MITLIILSVLIGFGAGFLSGQFGVGGGLITTPAIRLILQQEALVAVGTPLPIIIPTAISGFYNYRKSNLVDYKGAYIIGLVGAIFSIVGARLTIIIGGKIILLITALLVALTSFYFLKSVEKVGNRSKKQANKKLKIEGSSYPLSHSLSTETKAMTAPHNNKPKIYPSAFSYLAIGVLAGFMSGFLGLGGGFIIIPTLTILVGLNIKKAFGTSLLAIIIIAIPSSITHFLIGNINLPITFFISLGAIPGAYFGSKLTISIPSVIMNKLFSLFLLATAIYLAINELTLIGI